MSTIVITGANLGIGLALAERFSTRGDDVIAVCRDSSAELDALGVRVEADIEVTDPRSLGELAERLDDVRIDVLINNAGVMRSTELDGIEDQLDDFRLQFEVNSLAPLRVTSALAQRLGEGAKVAIITSRMGSIADNDSGGHYGYRMSKAAVNMAGASLAVDLKPRGIAVALLHPGYVRTGMTGHSGFCDADEAAAGLAERIDELSLETTGCFRHANGETLPW
jgi:NAD(P)-dependent dehydrogenase (short-subunit alcohol dehydrogenase family)